MSASGRPMDDVLAAFFGSLGDLIFEFDASQTIVRCYGTTERLGVSPQALTGRKLETALPLEASWPLTEAMARIREGGGPQTLEFLWSDVLRHYEAKVARTTANQFLVLLRDIHDRKSAQLEAACNREQLHESELRFRSLAEKLQRLNGELEERVRERTAALEVALRELESFSYSVSHDLRGPLRIIDGFSEMLFEGYAAGLDTRAQRLLEQMRRSTRQMRALIDDLLDLSRVNCSGLERRPADLAKIAHGVVENLRLREPGRQVRIDIEDGLTTDADGRLLPILLDNLLGNAWKFSAKTPDARLVMGAKRDATPTVYYVRDNGAGFDMAQAGKLFQPFQRLHDKEEFQGTGIGLATVRRIVERHGGRVWAEAVPGEGATFYFTLSAGEVQK